MSGSTLIRLDRPAEQTIQVMLNPAHRSARWTVRAKENNVEFKKDSTWTDHFDGSCTTPQCASDVTFRWAGLPPTVPTLVTFVASVTDTYQPEVQCKDFSFVVGPPAGAPIRKVEPQNALDLTTRQTATLKVLVGTKAGVDAGQLEFDFVAPTGVAFSAVSCAKQDGVDSRSSETFECVASATLAAHDPVSFGSQTIVALVSLKGTADNPFATRIGLQLPAAPRTLPAAEGQ